MAFNFQLAKVPSQLRDQLDEHLAQTLEDLGKSKTFHELAKELDEARASTTYAKATRLSVAAKVYGLLSKALSDLGGGTVEAVDTPSLLALDNMLTCEVKDSVFELLQMRLTFTYNKDKSKVAIDNWMLKFIKFLPAEPEGAELPDLSDENAPAPPEQLNSFVFFTVAREGLYYHVFDAQREIEFTGLLLARENDFHKNPHVVAIKEAANNTQH